MGGGSLPATGSEDEMTKFYMEYRHGCDWYLFGVYGDRSYAETWALIMREEGREARVTEVKGE